MASVMVWTEQRVGQWWQPALLGSVDEHDDARLEPRSLDELQVGSIDAIEQPLTGADCHWEHPEVELVDQVVLHECAVQRAGAVLHNILARLLLELGYLLSDVPFDQRRVPLEWPSEGPRCDVLRQAVKPVGECVT